MSGPMFVGREAELRDLEDAFQETAGSRLQLRLLAGPAGIGKTALVREFLDDRLRGHGALVAWGRAYANVPTTPLWPWIEVAREYAARATSEDLKADVGEHGAELQLILPELIRLDPSVEPSSVGGEEGRLRLYQAFVEVLARVSTRAPLVIVLDDLQWADQETVDLLAYVTRSPQPIRALVIVTFREAGREPQTSGGRALVKISDVVGPLAAEPGFRRMTVGPLPTSAIQAYVQSQLGAGAAEIAEELQQRSQGNPLFLRELVAEVDQKQGLPARESRLLPDTLREYLWDRLSGLSPESLSALNGASIFGREFSVTEVAVVSSLEPGLVTGLLEEARGVDAVEPAVTRGRWRFAHPLIEDAVRERVPLDLRSRMHQRAAETLAAESAGEPDRLEEVAHHYAAAVEANPALAELAVDYSRRSARQAESMGAWSTAASAYERALEIADAYLPALGAVDRAHLLIGLGRSRSGRLDGASAIPSLQQAIALASRAGDPEAHAEAALALVAARPDRSLARPIVDDALEALSGLKTPDPYLTARLLEYGNDFDRDVVDRVRKLAANVEESSRGDGLRLWADSRAARLAEVEGDWEAAIGLREQILGFGSGPANVQKTLGGERLHVLRSLATAYGYVGRVADYQRAADALLAAANRQAADLDVAMSVTFLAEIAWLLGHRRGLELASDRLSGMPPDVYSAAIASSRLAILDGDLERAWAAVRDQDGPQVRQPEARCTVLGHRLSVLAMDQSRLGELPSELAVWEQSFEDSRGDRSAELHPVARRAFDLSPNRVAGVVLAAPTVVAVGDQSLARRLLDYLRQPEIAGLRCALFGGSVDFARGVLAVALGEHREAEQALAEGASWARDQHCPLEEARNLVALAALEGFVDDDVRSTARDRARQLLGRMPRHPLAAVLDGSGSADPRAAESNLSGREIEVVRLIAAGHTNATIADLLSIAEPTVARHVSNILKKTGLSNRTEVAAFAIRRGLAD